MREKSAKKKAAKKKTAPKAKKARAAKKPTLAPRATVAKKKAAKKKAAKKKVAKKKAATTKAPRSAKPKAQAKTRAKTAAKTTPKPKPKAKAALALEPVALLPQERALTDEEREAMTKVAQTALLALETEGLPDVIVARIGQFVDEIRAGLRAEPQSQDIRLGLGVLWGEQVRAQVGWRWVHLSYPNGFASYALVPDDRAFACFPLNRITELMAAGRDAVNTSLPLFDSIRLGLLPARRDNEYLVIG